MFSNGIYKVSNIIWYNAFMFYCNDVIHSNHTDFFA